MRLYGTTYACLASLLLFAFPLSCSFAHPFKCSTNGRACTALVDYIPPNATTLNAISALFNVSSLLSLLGANNLPLSSPTNATVAAQQTIRIPSPCACTNGIGISDRQPIYMVAPGDTLDSIAAEVFAGLVTYQEIQAVNNISDANLIKVGQGLWIPLPCSCDEVDGQMVVHYGHVVSAGSTVGSIAQQYNVSQNTLLRLNNLVSPKDLMAGAVLDIPLRACSTMVRTTSLDYPLLVPSNTYVHTATNCVMCSCNASNKWRLQCRPSNISSSCSPIPCQGEGNLYLGNTISSGCNKTICDYAGYTKQDILTTLALESTCLAGDNSSAISLQGQGWKLLLIFIYVELICPSLLK